MPEFMHEASAEREPVEPQSVLPDLAPPDLDAIEKMLDELPPGIPILPPEDATNFSKYRYPPPMMPTPQAWKICTDAMEKYDSELCKAYREEIDTLLVFAGLFSAVVTGFTVESYQWLQDDPADTTNALLAQISRSLAPNGTAAAPPSASGMGRAVSARINAYWFISLALSLTAALVAILGKQWIREFERRTSDRSPKELIGVRQLKLEGLQYWKVGEIISALPMLLQLSLALFALGILELLWHLHTAVAVTVCIPTAAAVLFYCATTFLPVIQYSLRPKDGPAPRQCAYKSPQALAALHIYQIVAQAWSYLISHMPDRLWDAFETHWQLQRDALFWDLRSTGTWAYWDTEFYETDRYFTRPGEGGSPFRGLHWLSQNVDERDVQEAFWSCLWAEAHSSDAHRADQYFSVYSDWDTRLRRGIVNNDGAHPTGPLWQCAVICMPRRHMAHECTSEIVIQCLPSMDVFSADCMFGNLWSAFSDDPELLRSLVKAVFSYGRQHFNEDISGIIHYTSDIVTRGQENATQSALQWILVSLTANWLRSQADSGYHIPTMRLEIIRKNTFKLLSHSPEDFVHHPQRLHRLPHILALAGLLRAEYEHDHGHLTWPMPVPDYIRRYTMDGTRNSHPEWEPMVMEVFKISVCGGVDRDSPIGTSEHTNGRRDSTAHEDLPLLDAVPLAGAAGKAAAETARSHSYEGTLSAASFPGLRERAHGHDARDSPLHAEIAPPADAVEIIIVPGERDSALTSADAAVMGSLDEDRAGVQNACGEPELALSGHEGGDSMDAVHDGDAAVRSVGDPRDVSAALPQGISGSTPLPTGRIPAEPPSPRSRDPLALALPDAADALMRETAHSDDPGTHVGVHDASDQLAAASGVRAGMPPFQSKTGAAADDSSSTRSGHADVFRTLTDEISTRAGDTSVHAADEEVASLALHAHAEQPELTITLESHRVRCAPRTDTRALEVTSTDERHAPARSSGTTGHPETQRGEIAGGAVPSPERTARARRPSGRTLEASANRLEPKADARIAADAPGPHSYDQYGAEEIRGRSDEIGGGGERVDA